MREKKYVEVRLKNGIIKGVVFTPLLFVLMIYPHVKILKTRLGDRVEVLCYVVDPKTSMNRIGEAEKIHRIVKDAASVGIVINKKSVPSS